MSRPTTLYVNRGLYYLIMTAWSVQSLLRHGYDSIFVLVGDEEEQAIWHTWYPGIPSAIATGDSGAYPAFSYKPFALESWLATQPEVASGDIVVCDADVIWREDPAPLFERFAGKHWFHKLTRVDPADYDRALESIRIQNIGLRTSLHYKARYGLDVYPNFRLNAGLFQLPGGLLPTAITTWMAWIRRLPPEEMRMSEAILSHVYATLGWHPTSDDVKHGELPVQSCSQPVFAYDDPPPVGPSEYTGYQTASHFYGGQRREMLDLVRAQDLDRHHLLPRWERLHRQKRWQRRWSRARKALAKIFHG